METSPKFSSVSDNPLERCEKMDVLRIYPKYRYTLPFYLECKEPYGTS